MALVGPLSRSNASRLARAKEVLPAAAAVPTLVFNHQRQPAAIADAALNRQVLLTQLKRTTLHTTANYSPRPARAFSWPGWIYSVLWAPPNRTLSPPSGNADN